MKITKKCKEYFIKFINIFTDAYELDILAMKNGLKRSPNETDKHLEARILDSYNVDFFLSLGKHYRKTLSYVHIKHFDITVDSPSYYDMVSEYFTHE